MNICVKYNKDQGNRGDNHLSGDNNDRIIETYHGFVCDFMLETTNITGDLRK